MKKILLTVFLLVSVLSFGAKIGLEKGNKLDTMKLYNTLGNEVGTSEKYLDKITIYNFGASWCPPCKVEKPLLNKFYEKNKSEVNVVSIMIDNNAKDVDKFFKENPMDFPHYFDKNGILSRKFLIRVVPTSYIVNEKGIILQRIQGALDWSEIPLKEIKGL